MSAHSSPQGTTRSISTRNCARRVIFAYFSNPEPASVICLLFILVPRSCLLSAEALHFRQANRGLVQRFLRRADPISELAAGALERIRDSGDGAPLDRAVRVVCASPPRAEGRLEPGCRGRPCARPASRGHAGG